MNSLVRPLAVAAALTLGLGALGAPAASARSVGPAPAPASVVVKVERGRVHLPTSLRSARYRFVVKAVGRADGVQLVKPDRGYSLDEFRTDARRSNSSRPRVAKRAIRHLMANVRFFGGASADRGSAAVFWETLYSGRYWVLTETSERVREIRVHGPVRRTAMPRFDGTLRVRDGRVTAAPGAIPRRGNLLARSTGTQPHQLVVWKLAPGKTGADVQKFFTAVFSGDPGVDFADDPLDENAEPVTTGVLSPGTQYVMRYSLPRGNYAVFCVAPDLRNLDALRFHLTSGEVGQLRVR